MRGSDKFNKFIQGEKIVIVVGGKIQEQGLKDSTMTIEEIEMAVREHGVSSIAEADLVILEVDGNVTVLSSDYTHRTVKKRRKPQLSHNP